MTRRPWLQSSNPFDNATKNSYRKMRVIVADHNAKLEASLDQPGISALFDFFAPLHDRYLDQYSKWLSTKREYHTSSLQFRAMLQTLSGTLAQRWYAHIILVYPSRSAGYKKLLPRHRRALQRGPYDHRIAEVGALSISLQDEPALQHLKAEVDAF